MNIVDSCISINSNTGSTSYESSAIHLATRAVGDRSDPWLGTACRVTVAVGVGISTSLLIMRIYTKAKIIKKFWWDDSMCIVSGFLDALPNVSLAFLIIAWVCG